MLRDVIGQYYLSNQTDGMKHGPKNRRTEGWMDAWMDACIAYIMEWQINATSYRVLTPCVYRNMKHPGRVQPPFPPPPWDQFSEPTHNNRNALLLLTIDMLPCPILSSSYSDYRYRRLLQVLWSSIRDGCTTADDKISTLFDKISIHG